MKLLDLLRGACVLGLLSGAISSELSAHEPLRAHPENPYILEFRGQPTVLRTFAEHYSCVINSSFDFVSYLDVLKRDEMNLTRVFLLGFRLDKSVTSTARSPLSPDASQFLQPWQRVTTQGNALDGLGKWDFSAWNEEYFTRLESFLQASSDRGVVVQLSFFCAFYDDPAFWRASPFNPANNVQGVGPTNRHDSHRIVDAQLFAAQEAAVRRIVKVANRFDNVYFEIQNEPFWNEATVKDDEEVEFHNRMLAIIREEESALPNRHLVSHNYPQQINALSDDFDVINEHYPAVIVATAPDPKIAGAEALLSDHYFRGKILALDETNTLTPAQTRLEAWMFLLGGGGIYNGLDIPLFIYTDTNEAGDTELGREFRKPVRDIGTYMDRLHLVALRRNLAWVKSGIPQGATLQAMASPGQQYVAYLHHGRSGGQFQLFYDPIDAGNQNAALTIDLPPGNWRAVWTRPVDGTTLRTEEFTHAGGNHTLAAVVYQEDVALRIDRVGEGDRTPPPAPSGFIPSAKPDSSIQLAWDQSPADDVAFYHIYRSDRPKVSISENNRIAILPVGETAYPDPSLAAGTTYSYVVTAVDQQGNESGPSIEVSETSFLENIPFEGNPVRIPAVIQAENFDRGGQGVAYHDLTPENEGGFHRVNEAVDLKPTGDSDGGFDLTGIESDEWLEYTFDLPENDQYTIDMRFINAGGGGQVTFAIDGQDISTGTLIPATEDDVGWQILSTPEINISPGKHVLRMTFSSMPSGTNSAAVNWISFNLVPRVGPDADAGPDLTQTDQDLSGSENVTLTANATRQGIHPISSYSWSRNGTILGSGVQPTFDLPIGEHRITLTVTDHNGLQDRDELLVTITARGFANGGFENDFQGWTTTGNLNIQSSAPYSATEGRKLVAFNSANRNPNGTLSQSFATTPGKIYQIQFDAGVLSYTTHSQTLQLDVHGRNNLLSRSITINGVGGGASRWFPQSFTFTADQSFTTATFQDRSTTTQGLDLVLDQIRLTELGEAPVIPPQGVVDSYQVPQGTSLSVQGAGILLNDTNSSQFPLTAAIVTSTANGTLILNPNGSFIYTPRANFSGSDSFSYRAIAGTLTSNTTSVSITVVPEPSGPVAPVAFVNGSFEAGFTGWSVSQNVALQGASPYQPTQGTRLAAFNSSNLIPNGSISQTFATTPGQTYTVSFDAGVLAYNTNQQQLQVIATGASVLLSRLITLRGSGGGSNHWIPQQFHFTANSPSTTLAFQDQSTNTAAIDLLLDHVRVSTAGEQVNTAPIAADDAYATLRNRPLTLASAGLLANDRDEQLNALTTRIHTPPSKGNVTLNADGGFTYVPAPDFSGSDSFTYQANDGRLDSNIATVRISVNVIPSGIQIMPLGDSMTVGSNGSNAGYRGYLYNQLLDVAQDFRFVGSSRERPGSLPTLPIDQRHHEGHSSYTLLDVFNNLDGSDNSTFLRFGEPDQNPNGGHWLTGGNGTGRAPLFPDLILMLVGTTEIGNLTGVETRLQNLVSKITNLRPESKLLVAKIIPSRSAYQANVDTYNAQLTTIVTNLRAAGSNIHLADLNSGFPIDGLHPDGVHPNEIGFQWMANRWQEAIIASYSPLPEVVNTAPAALAESYTMQIDTEFAIPDPGVLGNDTDSESDPLKAVLVDEPNNGILVLNPGGGFIYTPRAGFAGVDSFSYHASDGRLNSEPVSVTLRISAAPTASIDNGGFENGFTGWTTTGNLAIQGALPYSATEGTRLVAFNHSNLISNGVLSRSISTLPGQTYTLAFDAGVLGYNTNSQTLQVAVTGTGNLLSHTITITSTGNGSNRWIPQSFTFVADGTSALVQFRDLSSSTAAVDLLLDHVRISQAANVPNTAPIAVADGYMATSDSPLVIAAPGVLQNDSDAQQNPLRAAIETGPQNGVVNLNPEGGFTYTAAPNFTGSDSFTYRAFDATLGSAVTTVTIEVNQPVVGALGNGSFEAGFSAWTSQGNVDLRSAAPYTAKDGAQLVAFNTSNQPANGILSQTFPTHAGKSYTLRFDVGVLAYNTEPQTLQVTASGNSDLLTRSITLNGLGGGLIRWSPQSFTFVADRASTTLRFRDQSVTSNALDLLLDHVRVEENPALTMPVSPPPDAAAFALMTEAPSSAPPPPCPSLTGTPGNLTVSMTAPRAGNYTLQSSSNLVDWKHVTSRYFEAMELIQFHESQHPPGEAAVDGCLFYRIGVPSEAVNP